MDGSVPENWTSSREPPLKVNAQSERPFAWVVDPMDRHEDDARYNHEQGNQKVEITILDDVHAKLLQPEPVRMFIQFEIVKHQVQIGARDDDGGE